MTYKFSVKDQSAKMASFLKEALGEKFSLKSIKKAIEKGACRVNKRIINYANHNLKKGDIIEIAIAAPIELKLETVFEDEHFLIVNKPAGLVSEDKEIKKFFSYPVFLVHRLDKETTGVLILAKNHEVKKLFETLFRERQVTKKYLAICDGLLSQEEGVIEVPLEIKKAGHNHSVVKIGAGSVLSKTIFRKIQMGKTASFVEFDIITGKTHQIRAHANYFGHPVLGDPIYLKRPVCTFIPNSLCLHAYFISFIHPVTGKSVAIYKAPPDSFMDTLQTLIQNARLPRYKNI
jgi:RluA family pseudouridine synthase